MIRPCDTRDFDTILAVINDAAEAYRAVIPEDRFHDPYMDADALGRDIDAGVRFWGAEDGGALIGITVAVLLKSLAQHQIVEFRI
ncbi:MAG: hypothetical protein IIA41_04875 [SAR324 cluster bacterium]|nr:hypothetical protein [SAR324 cluster bacterium]